ncbi:unnamed protein product, partial [Brassica oleracea]
VRGGFGFIFLRTANLRALRDGYLREWAKAGWAYAGCGSCAEPTLLRYFLSFWKAHRENGETTGATPDSHQSSSLLRPNHLSFFWVPADGEAESSVSSSYLHAHSNPTIINPKKKSRYGQTLSPYDSGEEEELDDESDDDEDWSLNDDFAEVTEYEKKKSKSQKPTIAKKEALQLRLKSLARAKLDHWRPFASFTVLLLSA